MNIAVVAPLSGVADVHYQQQHGRTSALLLITHTLQSTSAGSVPKLEYVLPKSCSKLPVRRAIGTISTIDHNVQGKFRPISLGISSAGDIS